MMTSGTNAARFVLFLFLTVLGTGCATTSSLQAHDLSRYGANSDATYRIDVAGGHGSGVVVSAEGHILTCHHVIENEASVSVTIDEGGPYPHVYQARVIADDPADDLAILKVDRRFRTPAVIGDLSEVRPGDRLYNIGYPYDFGEMTGRGYVMRLHFSADEGRLPIRDMILADIPDGPGTSGSGVYLESNGRLIGIMRMMIAVGRRGAPPMVVRGLVPVNRIRAFLEANRIPYLRSDGETATYPPSPPAPPPAPRPSPSPAHSAKPAHAPAKH
ncbi:MAG: hypothetical protein RL272_770 [Candidatus Parcubacteria bacterium]|jgi:S1-C subfamily serine protease